MSYQRLKAWNFGPAYAGSLANAGYALAGDTVWTPAVEVLDPDGDPTGGVQATVTFPDNFSGVLLWCPDTTATPKRYAFVEVNPGDDERTDAAVSDVPSSLLGSTLVNTTTVQAALRAIAAVLLGRLAEATDGSSSEFSDVGDPGTVRVSSVNDSTSRDVTLH